MKTKSFAIVPALAALLTLNVVGQTVPPQAAAVGFTKLVFDDEFTNANTLAPGSTPTATSKWYRYGAAVANDVAYKTGAGTGSAAGATGVLTLNNTPDVYNDIIQSVPSNATGSQRVGTFQHGYFEARMQFSSTVSGSGGPNTGWPSFWLWDVRELSPIAGQITAEDDILEAYPLGTAGATDYPVNELHTWDNTSSGSGTDIANTDSTGAVVSPAPPTDNGWHTWGCLWVATSGSTGYVQYYLDNVLITHPSGVTKYLTGAGTSQSAMESSYLYLILGTAKNWPVNVDWVHVWQSGGAGGALPQTIANFPPTLKLARGQYALTALTSAGLPITYSITYGPGYVAGDELTVGYAGTVIVAAKQAGNASYSPVSETETITVSSALK